MLSEEEDVNLLMKLMILKTFNSITMGLILDLELFTTLTYILWPRGGVECRGQSMELQVVYFTSLLINCLKKENCKAQSWWVPSSRIFASHLRCNHAIYNTFRQPSNGRFHSPLLAIVAKYSYHLLELCHTICSQVFITCNCCKILLSFPWAVSYNLFSSFLSLRWDYQPQKTALIDEIGCIRQCCLLLLTGVDGHPRPRKTMGIAIPYTKC